MKENKKFTIVCLILLLFSMNNTAQIFNIGIANEKYWYYRNRLSYFVKLGLNHGESNVARDRNNVLQATTIN